MQQIIDEEDEDDVEGFERPLVFNMDEARLFYNAKYTYTIDFRGSKRVIMDTCGGGGEK